MSRARKSSPRSSCWAFSAPVNGSANSRLTHGASRTPIRVSATMAVNATVVTTEAVSSSGSSRVRTNRGTNVEDRTPPRTSSYRMFGVVLARL